MNKNGCEVYHKMHADIVLSTYSTGGGVGECCSDYIDTQK